MQPPATTCPGVLPDSHIFISYRREDSGGHAGRICDRLTARFGSARVFMDLQDIAPGEDFAQSIDDTVAGCNCVVAVIGPRWLEAMRARAQGGKDFVHHEIAAALRRNIAIIPVLVGGARMPAAGELPPSVSALSYRNALEVRDERFDDDVTRLGDSIRALGVADSADAARTGRPKMARIAIPVVAAGLLLAVAGGYVALRSTGTQQALPADAPVSAAALDGDWVAEMQKEGQRPYQIRLTFAVAGDSITGMVSYPTGDGPVLDARLTGQVLTFHTSHLPQFESMPATIRYQAVVEGSEIRLTATGDFGLAKGVATRVSSPPAGRGSPRGAEAGTRGGRP